MAFTDLLARDRDPPWERGYFLAALSDIVYERDAAEREDRLALFGLTERAIRFDGWLAAGDTEISIVELGRDVVLVVRGTEADFEDVGDWLDLFTDIDLSLTHFANGAFIHAGFARIVRVLMPEVADQLGDLHGERRLWTVGHSLGGAVAQALGYGLHVGHPIRVEKTVTYGAPKIGGSVRWAAIAKMHGLRSERWVNQSDPVPYMPLTGMANPLDPRTWMPTLWTQYGTLNYIYWPFRIVEFDSNKLFGPFPHPDHLDTADHAIARYKMRLFDLLPDDVRDDLVARVEAPVSLASILRRANLSREEGEPAYAGLSDLLGRGAAASDESVMVSLALRFA